MGVRSTMSDHPLTVVQLFEHGVRAHGGREVVTITAEGPRRMSFAATADRVRRLAAGLRAHGVQPGDVVGALCWNRQEHLEAYFAVPCLGAVLHQLNLRLHPDQLAFVLEDLGDTAVIVDGELIDVLVAALHPARAPRLYVVTGDADAHALERLGTVVRYDELVGVAPLERWPDVAEGQAAAACHTSGTTGAPKGVVYSHRSIWTHTFGALAGGFRLEDGDRAMLAVPMFHANAWGLVHIAWIRGSTLLLPGTHPDADVLADLLADGRATFTAAVPTVLDGVLTAAAARGLRFDDLRWVLSGGSAVPRDLIERFEREHDVAVVQAWGMTEMSPSGAVAVPPLDAEDDRRAQLRLRAGRIITGVDLRLVDDRGREQPFDGTSLGEIQVRGPWVTARYHGGVDAGAFDDGWLRTGDVGRVDRDGFLQLVDRTKDLVKSGGEWISSVALEDVLLEHVDVRACAVIAIPDDHWGERPLACVVGHAGRPPKPAALDAHLRGRVPAWWHPDDYVVLDDLPMTSVGKIDKRELRERHARGALAAHPWPPRPGTDRPTN